MCSSPLTIHQQQDHVDNSTCFSILKQIISTTLTSTTQGSSSELTPSALSRYTIFHQYLIHWLIHILCVLVWHVILLCRHVNHLMYLSMHLSHMQQSYSNWWNSLRVILLLRCSRYLPSVPIHLLPNNDIQSLSLNISLIFYLWCQYAHLITMSSAFSKSFILSSTNIVVSTNILRKQRYILQLPFWNVLWQNHQTMTSALFTDIEHVFARCRFCLSQ